MFLLKYISINLFNICGIVELAVSDRAPPVADAARAQRGQGSVCDDGVRAEERTGSPQPETGGQSTVPIQICKTPLPK